MAQLNIFLLISLFFNSSLSGGNEACAVFANVEIICLSNHLDFVTPQERTRTIEENLKQISREPNFDPKRIHLVKKDKVTDIVSDKKIIASLSDDDARAYHLSRNELALETHLKVRASIKEARRSESPKALLLSVLLALISSLLFVFIVFVLSAFFKKLKTRIRMSNHFLIRPIVIYNYQLLSRAALVTSLGGLIRIVKLTTNLLLFYSYVSVIASCFPQTANLTPTLIDYALKPLKELFALCLNFLPNLFFLFAIFVATKYGLQVIKFIFKEIGEGKLVIDGFYREWAQPTYKLIRFLVFAIALVMAFPYIPGSSSPAFQGMSIFLGLLFSIGSSSAVSNLVSGVVITYMRPFKVGDSVKIADTIGDVVERNLLVTRIRTMKEIEITIPNSMALASHIVNYSVNANTTGIILNPTLTVAYDIPWKVVHDLLQKAAFKTAHIETDPAPFVLQIALKETYVSYELNAYTRNPGLMIFIYSELHQHIQDGFREAGISIVLPHFLSIGEAAPALKNNGINNLYVY